MDLLLSPAETVNVTPATTSWPAGTHTTDTTPPTETPGPDMILADGECITVSHNNAFVTVRAHGAHLVLEPGFNSGIQFFGGAYHVVTVE